MAGVTFDHLTKRFDDATAAVDDLSLEIPDKEFLVLVGPSGSGKSTALRMLAGLEEITEGSIYIGDRLVNDVAAKDRDIAMVFQSYALRERGLSSPAWAPKPGCGRDRSSRWCST